MKKWPVLRWLVSSIGKKTIVALTGVCLAAFVTGHLIGNFTVFLGQDWLNIYAEKLQALGPILWLIRLGMLVIIGCHIYFTMLIWFENAQARPQKYAVDAKMGTTVFSRTMRLTGIIIVGFLVFHIMHFTLRSHGVVPNYEYEVPLHGEMVHNVYGMVVAGFQNPLVSGAYILWLLLIAFHLNHGVASFFQTIGVTNKYMRPLFEWATRIYVWLLFLGYISIPLYILIATQLKFIPIYSAQ